MKSKRILMAVGAFALTAASVIAVRANAKKASPAALWYTAGSAKTTCTEILSGLSSSLFTTTATGTHHQVQFLTVNGGATAFIYATSGCKKEVYFN
jgi:hypothetical protein